MSGQSVAEIRAELDHPVIDIDGHVIEYFPALAGHLAAEGLDVEDEAFRRLLPGAFGPYQDWYAATPDERAAGRIARPPWWGSPARNTRDLATAMLPNLLYERLDELGIDVSVVYPSIGLNFLHFEDPALRQGACRALNRYSAEAFADHGDRLIPVAAIPMHTPDEAIAGLEHAVHELGLRAVLMAGYVQRPADAVLAAHPEAAPWAQWLDFYGIDSAHDYDPVWAACRELGVSVAFHSGSIGWGSRRSTSSYMYNHIGHLAEGQHALAKSLLLGGVTRRFPELNFAFLEGGVSWAATLYADLIGHWEKRNLAALDHLDPANIDKALFGELLVEHGGAWLDIPPGTGRIRRGREDPADLDEFAACAIEAPEDFADLFARPFYFGCEADDPMTTTAFNTKVNPFGSKLHAMFGSDIAHWDVPDMAGVLGEAWEMVEHELLDLEEFRDFTFANPIRFFTGANPAFFKGTVVEGAVDAFLNDQALAGEG